jgi:dTDP-4-dehydrorhamnose reductase
MVDFAFNVELYVAKEPKDYREILSSFKPNSIVNFLRGEDENGFEIHKDMLTYSEKNRVHYIYASSALALDGYRDIELTESILANGISEYGAFKAKCEQTMYDSSSIWTILRFSSLQGYSDIKFTRNENLLHNLSLGKTITVDTGVIQNRMMADLMISGVVKIIEQKVKGIIHFGTIDTSDELDFLRKQAVNYGYSEDVIKASNLNRNVNLNCIPDTIIRLFGKEYNVKESDTLKQLWEINEFVKYIKR